MVRLLLKNTFLFFLGHLAFVLLQSSLQMLIFFFGPGSQTGNEIIFLRGGQSSTPLFPRPSGCRYLGASGRLPGPPETSGLKFKKLLGPSAGAEPPPKPAAHSLLLLCIQVPDERVTLVHQGHQLIQQELLASLLGLSLLPVCRQEARYPPAGPLHTLPPLPAFSSSLEFLHKPFYRTTS